MKKITLLAFMVFVSISICTAGDAAQNTATALIFPSFSANNLNDIKITVPDPVSPKVEVVVMTFARQDIAQTDAWINTFTALYKGSAEVCYSQTAVIGDIPFIGGLIINGMKGSLAKDRLERFLIYTGDKEKLAKAFNVDDPKLFYVYVVGKDGVIKWSLKSAKPSDEEVVSMLEAVKKELETPLKAGKKNK